MASNLRSQEDAVFLYNQQTQEIGSLLKKASEEISLSLEEVSGRLHICKTYLLALEEGHFDKLPGKVYLFGFLQRYAKSLYLDSQELVRRIERVSPDDFHLSHLPLARAEDQFPQKKYIIYSSFILSLFVLSYLIYQVDNKTIEPTLLAEQRDVSELIVSEPTEEPITSIVSETIVSEPSEPAAEPFEESLPTLVL
ncbi:MAG: helix-turn-helix domain-containing protein, partial [Proteobacteria bacterium]|nr:helix-turn-helix domain-containing protein [Pseudomonadota bacterium]